MRLLKQVPEKDGCPGFAELGALREMAAAASGSPLGMPRVILRVHSRAHHCFLRSSQAARGCGAEVAILGPAIEVRSADKTLLLQVHAGASLRERAHREEDAPYSGVRRCLSQWIDLARLQAARRPHRLHLASSFLRAVSQYSLRNTRSPSFENALTNRCHTGAIRLSEVS